MTKLTSTPTKPIVDALDNALMAIRRRHPEVPNVVLVVGTSSAKKYGHFHAQTWDGKAAQHEVMLSGEGLQCGSLDVLGTLLHECAHALAYVRGIKDTSRQGRFHNAKFKALAEEIGIDVEQDPTIGWSLTTVPERTKKLYAEELKALTKALKHFRVPEEAVARPKTTLRVDCGCRGITLPISFLDKGDILCAECDLPFVPSEGILDANPDE